MIDFAGKVAIVTGGGRDIGRGISLKLAEGGARVVVNYYLSESDANETVRRIADGGGMAIAVQADVTNPDDISRMIDRTADAFGDEIHILVNNAGGLLARKPFAEIDRDFWHKVMAVNLDSVLYVTQAVLPHMPDGGAIVNLSSLAARNGGGSGAIAYSAAKGAVLTFTRGLAKELGPRNIRVNCVSPGLIDTTFHDTFTPAATRSGVAAGTPLRREGTAEEVGDAVAFLASEASRFITGESLEINGGVYFT